MDKKLERILVANLNGRIEAASAQLAELNQLKLELELKIAAAHARLKQAEEARARTLADLGID